MKPGENSKNNEIYIGDKPIMNYVTAVIMQLNSGAKTVVIKARGKYISKAVDIAEIMRNRFMPDLKEPQIASNSEQFTDDKGKIVRVSTIAIELER